MTRRRAVQIIKPPITWILVADGRKAQIYTRQKVEKLMPLNGHRNQFEEIIAHEPTPVPGMKWEAESPDLFQAGRRPKGQVFESASPQRYGSEPHMDLHEEIRTHFAKEIAVRLSQKCEAKTFDRLVLVAPARMLGEIKKYLSGKAVKKIAAEMPKDLTHFDAAALANHLGHIA